MKIEIGESLIISWLKHVKNCQIAQMNWKPSTKAWNLYNDIDIDEILSSVQSKYNIDHSYDLFRQSVNVNQIIQQGEIDVLGIELNDSKIVNLYAVDVAFHENGLNYGNNDITVARVLKKMVRMAVTIYGYFNMSDSHIIFASPKINNSIYTDLSNHISDVNDFINNKWGLNFKFELVCNNSFDERILSAVKLMASDVADTSELFMRSLQLINIFEKPKGNREPRRIAKINTPTGRDTYPDIKIGSLVRTTLPEILKDNKISDREISDLQDANFCKDKFDVNYPVLRKINSTLTIRENRFVGDYPRYYAFQTPFRNDNYLITSEWFDKNKDRYINWLKQVDLSLFEK